MKLICNTEDVVACAKSLSTSRMGKCGRIPCQAAWRMRMELARAEEQAKYNPPHCPQDIVEHCAIVGGPILLPCPFTCLCERAQAEARSQDEAMEREFGAVLP